MAIHAESLRARSVHPAVRDRDTDRIILCKRWLAKSDERSITTTVEYDYYLHTNNGLNSVWGYGGGAAKQTAAAAAAECESA